MRKALVVILGRALTACTESRRASDGGPVDAAPVGDAESDGGAACIAFCTTLTETVCTRVGMDGGTVAACVSIQCHGTYEDERLVVLGCVAPFQAMLDCYDHHDVCDPATMGFAVCATEIHALDACTTAYCDAHPAETYCSTSP